VNLGVSLSLTALLLALLSLDWNMFLFVIFKTVTDVSMISVMFAAFGIMVISQLYKETKAIGRLSDSLSKMIHNSKLVVAVLPAIIGLLPVAGGALMSAPLVESEADKLGLSPEKKTYVNIWFRHTIFPVYPISQVLILTEKLTGATVTSIIIRQIPVVISMIVVGYFLSFWRIKTVNEEEFSSTHIGLELKKFIVAFSPIFVTIIIAVFTNLDVSVAILAGIITLLLITRPSIAAIKKPFNNSTTYSIAFAVFGAFFLRNIVERTGISQIFGSLVIDGSSGLLLLLILVPAALAFFVGSPLGAIAISASLLGSLVVFNSRNAALLYIASYLSYVVAPTHLCLVLTADYFKGSFQKIYRCLIPSVVVSLATAVLIYVFV
jgi:integral membrane protein (TIGR00529 family)